VRAHGVKGLETHVVAAFARPYRDAYMAPDGEAAAYIAIANCFVAFCYRLKAPYVGREYTLNNVL
jgi:hypothetical protein